MTTTNTVEKVARKNTAERTTRTIANTTRTHANTRANTHDGDVNPRVRVGVERDDDDEDDRDDEASVETRSRGEKSREWGK